MSDWLMQKIRLEAQRLLALAVDDPRLRADLRVLASEILEATSAGKEESTTGPTEENTGSESPEPLRELTLGQSRWTGAGIAPSSASQSRRSSPGGGAGADLATIETRCRQRAEAARFVAESQRRAREGTDSLSPAEFLNAETMRWADNLSQRVPLCERKVAVEHGGGFPSGRRRGLFRGGRGEPGAGGRAPAARQGARACPPSCRRGPIGAPSGPTAAGHPGRPGSGRRIRVVAGDGRA